MNLTVWEEHRKRKVGLAGIWCLVAISLFYAVVCTPVYHWAVSDILIADTVFPQIWELLQILLQFLFYWTAFAFAIYLSVRYSLKQCQRFLIGYAVCVVLRYFANLIAGYVMLAGKDGWENLGSDLLYMLLDVFGDLVQMALAVLIIWLLIEKKRAPGADRSIRLTRLFDFSNPLLRCVWCVVAIPSVIQLLSRIYYDIFFGAPQNLYDLLSMIFSYFLTIASVPIGYLAVFLIINQLNLKDEEAKQRAGESISGSDL